MDKTTLDKAYELKKQFWSYNDIGVELGYDPSHVRAELKAKGYDLKGLGSSKTGGRNRKKGLYSKAIELREQGYSIVAIAAELGCNSNSLYEWGIGRLENNPNAQSNYPKDFSLFETYTKETAYFLGLLFADGNVRDDAVRLELEQQDVHILQELKDRINPELPIRYRDRDNNGRHYRLEVSSRYLTQLLESYGLGHSFKKQNLLSMQKLPNYYLSHFVRGYFDGDGCIDINGTVSLSGPEQIVKEILSLLIQLEIAPADKKISEHPNKKTCEFSLCKSSDVKAFYSWLYENASLYLTRKKARFAPF